MSRLRAAVLAAAAAMATFAAAAPAARAQQPLGTVLHALRPPFEPAGSTAPAVVAFLTVVVAGTLLLRRRRTPLPSVMLGGTVRAPVASHAAPAVAVPVASRRASNESQPAPMKRKKPSQRPQNTVRSLAGSGLSHAEIAARLRVSRDVVALMLATAAPDEAAASGRNFPAVRAGGRWRPFASKR